MFPSLSCIFHIILQWREPETCPGTDPRLSRWGADGKVLTFICWQEKGEAAKLPKLLRYFHLHGILWEYVHSYHGTMGRSLGKMGRSLGNMIHLYTLGYFMGSYGNMSIPIMGRSLGKMMGIFNVNIMEFLWGLSSSENGATPNSWMVFVNGKIRI